MKRWVRPRSAAGVTALTNANVLPCIAGRSGPQQFARDQLFEAFVTFAGMEAGGR